jgi:plastocyanin
LRRRAPLTIVSGLIFITGLAACGGGNAPIPTPPPGAVVVIAQGTAFTTQNVVAPAGAAFTLDFENRDSELHNVHISDAAGATVFSGQTITGPTALVEQVPALAAGTYRFICDVHPGMAGQLVAE